MSIAKRLITILRASIPKSEKSSPVYSEEPAGSNSVQDNDYDSELAGYYANLEISYNSDIETVKSAWKKLLKKYHPDLHGNDREKEKIAHQITQGINHAYKMICKKRGFKC